MNLSQLDLNLLVALDALLRERNVTRAGASIGLSQPAMSSALGRLRRLFNDDLLVRVGREYFLTALARDLMGPVQDILRMIEHTVERRPVFNPATDKRSFRVAASDYALYLILKPLLARISETAPGVFLQIEPMLDPYRSLESGDLDLVFLPGEFAITLPSQTLFTDTWKCVVWSGNKSVGDKLTMDEYMALPHLAYGTTTSSPKGIADTAIDLINPNRRIQATLNSFLLLPLLITGTNMVALLHSRLARQLAPIADIKVLEPPFKAPPIYEGMFWHPRNTADPAHVWLREQIVEVTADL